MIASLSDVLFTVVLGLFETYMIFDAIFGVLMCVFWWVFGVPNLIGYMLES